MMDRHNRLVVTAAVLADPVALRAIRAPRNANVTIFGFAPASGVAVSESFRFCNSMTGKCGCAATPPPRLQLLATTTTTG